MLQRLLLPLAVIFLFCCDPRAKKNLSDRKEKIFRIDNTTLSRDQVTRKQSSIIYCRERGIPVIDHLPCVTSEAEVKIRSNDDIINRALALCYLGLKSEGLEKKHLDGFNKKYLIAPHFTKEEKLYVYATTPLEEQRVNASWRYEGMHVLLWALGYVDSLAYPDQMCNVEEDVKLILDRTKAEFSTGVKIRSKQEILDQADLIYRLHWACVNAKIKNEEPPAGLNASVVYERHYALNWLIRYMEQEWDEVSTDT